MSKRIGIFTLIFSCCAFVLSLVCMILIIVNNNNNNKEQVDIQYVLYLGTNDKDTNLPKFDEEKAKEEAEKILINHFSGYTIQTANGGWKENDIIYNEFTLVIYLSDTNIDKVHKACDDLIAKFNQSSILIQSNKTMTEFYSN